MKTKKIKICFFIGTLDQGGAEKQFVELIKHINKNLFEITLCIYSKKEVFFKEIFEFENLEIISRSWSKKTKIGRLFELFQFTQSFLSNRKFDLVQTTLRHNGVFLRLFSPKFYKNRIITSMRSRFDRYHGYKLLLEKLLLKNSFAVVNSQVSFDLFKKQISPKYHERVYKIYNGFDTNIFIPKNKKHQNNKIVIGLVGRINKEKNFEQIVRVAEKLDDIFLIKIIGQRGDSYSIIRQLIETKNLQHKVLISPPIREIKDFYYSIDICLLTSFYEGCPNVLFEALLCKTFCIINKVANTDNFVTHNTTGFIYDGTDEDLINKIKSAQKIINYSTYNEIRENGYNYSFSNFSVEKMVENYENVYLNILKKYHECVAKN